MTAPTQPDTRISFERQLDASPETVFRAISEPAHIARWYGPSDDYTIEVSQWEFHPGGHFRIAMRHKGGNVHTVLGEFREIVVGKRVSHTWTWEGQPRLDTLVTFVVEPTAEGTRLTLTHTGFPTAEHAGRHHEGWTGSLARLVRSLSTR